MTHYINFRIRILPELSAVHVMEKLFEKIHLALVDLKSTDIGVSFPEMDERKYSLGTCVRLHGKEQSLQKFIQHAGLVVMADYLSIGDILPIPPSEVGFRLVSRVQVKSGVDRLRRRFAKRHNISFDEAKKLIPETVAKTSKLPFIKMQSKSSGEAFHLFIHHGPIQKDASEGAFNSYGLSVGATIPWFDPLL